MLAMQSQLSHEVQYNQWGMAQKEILLMSDSHLLLDAVGANLGALSAEVQVVKHLHGGPAPLALRDGERAFRLIVLALSQERPEPLALLAQAGLAGAVGVAPLLIIAHQPFRADRAQNILRLPLPVQPEALAPIVAYLLNTPQFQN